MWRHALPIAEFPVDEQERIAAVYELKLLDTPPEPGWLPRL